MPQALPFGEIRPGARPIGSFVQPGQANIADATRATLLDNPSGVNAIQRAGGGNIQGYNGLEQLTTALSPFSKQLTELAGEGMLSYAKGRIDEGYYAELKNQQARAMASLQQQKEQGAANSATTIGQLQKVDPVAGQLLKDANPWKQVGIERARAQLAAAQVDNVLADDVTKNAGYLATLAPGSPELVARKASLINEVYKQNQLTGDETAVQYYVTPQLNKAWDEYTNKHSKLRSAAVYQQTVLDTSALGMSGIESAVRQGFTMQDGSVLKPGTPEWRDEGHKRFTGLLDSQLALLPPDERAKAMEQLRKNFGTLTGVPFVWDLITGIRVGDSSVPYEKRPTWGSSQTAEFIKERQANSQARLEEYNNDQKFKENEAKIDWLKGPGSMPPGPRPSSGTTASARSAGHDRGHRV
jgi:hypothetical protein